MYSRRVAHPFELIGTFTPGDVPRVSTPTIFASQFCQTYNQAERYCMSRSPQLTDEEVRNRLRLCEDPEVVNEIYSFGQVLEKESVDHIRILESKATSFAAYGAAIVTLLVSSSQGWSRFGNQWTSWIAVCAAICGLICTGLSVRVLTLQEFKYISEDDWLKEECLSNIYMLKRYRILTMWGTIDSHDKLQREKAVKLQRAQVWLTGAVIFLLYLLFHIALVQSLTNPAHKSFWIALGHLIMGHFGIGGWQFFLSSSSVGGGLVCAFILGLTFALIFWHSRLT